MYKAAPRKLSTPRKLMISLICIFFAIMVGSNVLLNISISQLTRETMSSLTLQYENTLTSLTDNFDRIYSLSLNLLDDNDLNNLAKLPNLLDHKMKIDSMSRLQEKLTIIKNSNSLINNISVFLPQYSIMIHAEGNQSGSITRYTVSGLNEQVELTESWTDILETHDGKLLIPITSSNISTGKIYCSIIVELSNKEITRLIESVTLGEVQYSFGIQNKTFLLEQGENKEMLSLRENADAAPATLNINGKEYIFLSVHNLRYQIQWHTMLSSTPLMMPVRVLSMFAYVLIGLVILCGGIYIYMDYALVDKPLRLLIAAFQKVENDDLNVRLTEHMENEFGYLFMCFNNMTSHVKLLIDKTYKQQLLIQRAELKQLQEQTNPHFLYNSYFMLHRLVKGRDYEKAVRFSHEMGQYLKYITRSGRDFVELWEENEHARIYAEIQAVRFTGRISVDYQPLPEDCRYVITPRLIMQPLIENSFIHGLDDMESGGVLKVSFYDEGEYLVISVEDNGGGLTDEGLSAVRLSLRESTEYGEVTAIMNINRRMQLLFGEACMLRVDRSCLGGLKTEILLPRGHTDDKYYKDKEQQGTQEHRI